MAEAAKKAEPQASQTTCQAGIAPHHYGAHSVDAGPVQWVLICMSCGHIDNDNLIAQQRESNASPANGYAVVPRHLLDELLAAVDSEGIYDTGWRRQRRVNRARAAVVEAVGPTREDTK